MSLHESPMIARWFGTSDLSCQWAEEVVLVAKSGRTQRRRIDAVAVLDETGRTTEVHRDALPPLLGRDVVVVQAKASPLAVGIAGQAIGTKWLADRLGARSVRSVLLCARDNPTLRPLVEARGVEIAIDSARCGPQVRISPAKQRIVDWVASQHDPVVLDMALVPDGTLRAHAVVFHGEAPEHPGHPDLAGREVTIVTALAKASKGGNSFGMSPFGMALLNRDLALRAGASSVRESIILTPEVDPVMGQLCERFCITATTTRA